MVFPLRGGGSKEALLLSTKNRLEAFLIAQGVSLDDVRSFCPELIKVSGPTSILQALDLDSSMKTIEALNDLSKKAKLSMPKMQDLHSRAATKLQKAIRQKALSRQKQLKACQFRLADDFFRNSDKTAAAVLPKFTLQSSGVALLDQVDLELYTDERRTCCHRSWRVWWFSLPPWVQNHFSCLQLRRWTSDFEWMYSSARPEACDFAWRGWYKGCSSFLFGRVGHTLEWWVVCDWVAGNHQGTCEVRHWPLG